MKNKKIIIAITSILAIILILSISVYKTNNENKLINRIETGILNGHYEEAVELINESNNENMTLYKNILEDFLLIKGESNIEKSKEKIDIFKEKYANDLNNKVFSKLNEDISEVEKNVQAYYDGINNDKEKISIAINEDISLAKELIDKFKEKYPNEEISSIEDTYNKKVAEIKNQEEERKIAEESAPAENNEDDNSSIVNDTTEKAELAISNTVASSRSSQIITVVSKGGSYGELVFWEKDSAGKWFIVDKVSARLGQNGMKAASDVYEMDKSTPTGIYSLTEAFGINPDPGSMIRYRQLDGSEYWVDDVYSEYYNTMQFGEPNGRWNSAEKLIDYQGYYNYSVVIDYNRWPVIPGKSSAIFLHCDTGSYTYGCVAIPEQNLVNIIKRLDPKKDPFIIIDFSYQDIYTKY